MPYPPGTASLYILLLGCAACFVSGEESLYGPSDPLVILDRDNIHNRVPGSKTAWLVEFYSSWCGHCIRFAPTFKDFAQRVKGWKDILQIGVLDCAEESNRATCRAYDVNSYPTLKLFPPGAANDSKGKERESYSKTIESLIKDTAEFAASQKELQEYFPRMESNADVSSVFKHNSQVAVFLNPQKSKYGPGLFLSLFKNLSSLHVPLYLSGSKDAIAASFAVKGERIPRTLSLPGKDLEEDAQLVLRRIHDVLDVKKPTEDNGSMVDRRRYRVYMSDLENALIYALKHEVATHSIISGDKLSALQTFSEVLFKYFPGRKSTRRFLGELKAWIFGHEDVIKGEELETHFQALSKRLGAFDDTPKDWVGCKGSSKRYGGYPCSLWTLFHTLTVNHAGVTSDSLATKMDVLDAMRLYVKEYFGCRDCARHFEQEWSNDSPSNSILRANDSIIWLWRIHNKVNLRLSGDLSDDPSFPKGKFPDIQHCRTCYAENSRSGKRSDALTEGFDLKEVFLFLKDLYGKRISYEGLSKDTEFPVAKGFLMEGESSLHRSHESSNTSPFKQPLGRGISWFSLGDMGLIMIFNIGALVLIVWICRKVVIRRKCKLLNGAMMFSRNSSSSSSLGV